MRPTFYENMEDKQFYAELVQDAEDTKQTINALKKQIAEQERMLNE